MRVHPPIPYQGNVRQAFNRMSVVDKRCGRVTFRIFLGMIPLPDNDDPRSIRFFRLPVHANKERGVYLDYS